MAHSEVEKRNVGVLTVVNDADAHRAGLELEGGEADFSAPQVQFLFGQLLCELFVIHPLLIFNESGVGSQPNGRFLLKNIQRQPVKRYLQL